MPIRRSVRRLEPTPQSAHFLCDTAHTQGG
jgi:hypothetical protein